MSTYTAYIAGPMTGLPNYNFDTFSEVREHLYLRGLPAPFLTEDIVVINPAENFNGDQDLPRRVYLSLAVRQVQNADGIVLLPEWHQSPGAQLEAQLGLDLDRDFYVAHKRDDINWEIGRTSHEVIQNVLNAMAEDLNPAAGPANEALSRVMDLEPPWSEAVPIEREASRLVRNGEREKDYGHPRGDFDTIAHGWTRIFGVEVTAEQVALAMIWLKMSRLLSNPKHRDSLRDVIGYSICYDRLDEAAA